MLSFFPVLSEDQYNPRAHLVFEDASGDSWEFAFIHYNNRRFGGTRNEYRLTRMTRYIRHTGLSSGDEIILHRDECGEYSVRHRFAAATSLDRPNDVLKLGGGWCIIDIRK